jgi:hypothetical protein
LQPDHVKLGYVPRVEGERLPASYINHYIANGGAVIPQFGGKPGLERATETDKKALEVLQKAYGPERKVGHHSLCPDRCLEPHGPKHFIGHQSLCTDGSLSGEVFVFACLFVCLVDRLFVCLFVLFGLGPDRGLGLSNTVSGSSDLYYMCVPPSPLLNCCQTLETLSQGEAMSPLA